MRYNQQRLQGVTRGVERVFLTYTSYCYTQMTLKMNENGICTLFNWYLYY